MLAIVSRTMTNYQSTRSHGHSHSQCGTEATKLKWLQKLSQSPAPRAAVLGHDGTVLSHSDLFAKIMEAARQLSGLGITAGDRIISMPANDIDGAVRTLAAASIAGCAVINPLSSVPEVERVATAVRPAAILAAEDIAAKATELGTKLGIPVIAADQARPGAPLRADRPPGRPPVPQRADWTGIILSTSGTTASGKLVPLSWPTMLAAASATAGAYRLTRADRRLNVMPIFHVQGLVGSLLSALLSGGSIALIPSFDPREIPGLLRDTSATWFSATPPMHTEIMDSWAGGSVQHSLRFVRVGSSALPGILRQRLASFYRVPVVESYGMTEANQIASTPVDGDGTEGLRPTGSQVAIRTENGIVTTPRVRGEIVVRGENVADRYLAATETEQLAFRDGWFHTGDEGELRSDGSLWITGRLKELINRGGEKISPAEVENVLLSHDDVAEATVVGLPDEALGQQVAAAVVPCQGARPDEASLLTFARGHLAPHKLPRMIVFVDDLPRTASGKISRAAVAADLASLGDRRANPRPAAPGHPAADRAQRQAPRLPATHAALTALWSGVLGRPVDLDDDFIVLGGESITAVELLQDVEAVFCVRISLITMFDDAFTIRRMGKYIDQYRAAERAAAANASLGGPLPATPVSEEPS
jgi:acyl-CoA synthetase (AMP-forming)/AMP-acid ligase II